MTPEDEGAIRADVRAIVEAWSPELREAILAEIEVLRSWPPEKQAAALRWLCEAGQ